MLSDWFDYILFSSDRAALLRCLPWAYRVHFWDASAQCLLKLGKLHECAEALERVQELQPNNLIANDLLCHWHGTVLEDHTEAQQYQAAIDEEIAVDDAPSFDPLAALWRCYLPEELPDAELSSDDQEAAVAAAAAGRTQPRPHSAALGRPVESAYAGDNIGAVSRAGQLPPLVSKPTVETTEVERGAAAAAAAAEMAKKMETNLVAQAFKVQPTYASVLRKVRSCYSGPLTPMEQSIFARGPESATPEDEGKPTESLAEQALRAAQERGQRERAEREEAKLKADEEAAEKAQRAAEKASKEAAQNAKNIERSMARAERAADAAKRKAEQEAAEQARKAVIGDLS
eukprot:SAG31_NODE_1421_length_8423_cov_2.477054_9_plen_345_part_00